MSRIEIPISEYQGMKTKIRNLEDALNSVSKEAAANKETIEQMKSLVSDLGNETFFERLFRWKSIVEPFKTLLEKNARRKQDTNNKKALQ